MQQPQGTAEPPPPLEAVAPWQAFTDDRLRDACYEADINLLIDSFVLKV